MSLGTDHECTCWLENAIVGCISSGRRANSGLAIRTYSACLSPSTLEDIREEKSKESIIFLSIVWKEMMKYYYSYHSEHRNITCIYPRKGYWDLFCNKVISNWNWYRNIIISPHSIFMPILNKQPTYVPNLLTSILGILFLHGEPNNHVDHGHKQNENGNLALEGQHTEWVQMMNWSRYLKYSKTYLFIDCLNRQ